MGTYLFRGFRIFLALAWIDRNPVVVSSIGTRLTTSDSPLDVARRDETLDRALHGSPPAIEFLRHLHLRAAAPPVIVGVASQEAKHLQIARLYSRISDRRRWDN